MINSPIRWAGGKSRLRKHIIPMIPQDHSTYVEPFAGGAWVLFGKSPSITEVLNDLDPELITFFQILRDDPQGLIDSFEWELVSRAEFNRLANLDPATLTTVQRAHRFYYLTMACWGAESAFPRFQTSPKDGGHGNRLIGALQHLRDRMEPAHRRLKGVIIHNLDWQQCMRQYDDQRTTMYLDPPYLGNGVNYRYNLRSLQDHRELATHLKNAKSSWILSAYDNENTRNMFQGFHMTPVTSYSGMPTGQAEQQNGRHRSLNQELLITNFTPPKQELPGWANIPIQQTNTQDRS